MFANVIFPVYLCASQEESVIRSIFDQLKSERTVPLSVVCFVQNLKLEGQPYRLWLSSLIVPNLLGSSPQGLGSSTLRLGQHFGFCLDIIQNFKFLAARNESPSDQGPGSREWALKFIIQCFRSSICSVNPFSSPQLAQTVVENFLIPIFI